jgi:hypothetical protein
VSTTVTSFLALLKVFLKLTANLSLPPSLSNDVLKKDGLEALLETKTILEKVLAA